MEMGLKKIVLLFLPVFVLGSCDKYDVKGFFISYQSVNERFRQSMEWNDDHPSKEITVPVDDYFLYAMGDSHVGGTKNLDTFFHDAIKEKAAAVVMVGDLTTGNAGDYEIFRDHLPGADSLISFPVVGNHDLYFDGWKHFYSIFGSSTYYFTVKTPEATDLYICLDSGSGTLGPDQLEWLKGLLKNERSGYRYCVLFSHVNLFRNRHTPSTNPLVEELRVIMELCIEYRVDMVVTGHDHVRNEGRLGNTVYITMDALLDGCTHASYLKLAVHQGILGHEFISLQ